MDKYIDQYWKFNVTRKEAVMEEEFSISQMDEIVHNLIHELLKKAEDDK